MKIQLVKILKTTLIVAMAMGVFDLPASAAYKEGKVKNGGEIKGKIIYTGSIPTKRIVPTKNRDVCGKVRKRSLILVGEGNGVGEVVVFIKKISTGKAWPKKTETVLDQKGCVFYPHVQVMRSGQLSIVNSDPVLHNTHGYYGKRTAFNVGMPDQGQKIKKALKRAGMVRVDCDAHGWMEGWVQVIDNPYFAVTDANGNFTLTDVPAGTYKLTVWQEHTGTTEVSVTVKAGAQATANVELKK